MRREVLIIIICTVIISSMSCTNSSQILKYEHKNNNKLTSIYPIDSTIVPKLIVSDTCLFAILDELIIYAEKHIPEYNKNRDAAYFEFATHLQSDGIFYKVSLEGYKYFIEFSATQNILGAFFYKNNLFIIRKNFKNCNSPFTPLDEKITLYNDHCGFGTVFEMGNIRQNDHGYKLEIIFNKYILKVK